jgi:nucleotide-binding universal stress UspA family protein
MFFKVGAAISAWGAETVFIGARGLGVLDRLLLGGVSTAVVTHAECAVEVVRYVV